MEIGNENVREIVKRKKKRSKRKRNSDRGKIKDEIGTITK